MKTKQQPTRSL